MANTMYIPSFPTYLSVYIDQKKNGSNTRATFFVNVFKKWPPIAILDAQRSLLTISDQYHNFYFCEFCLQNFGCPKLISIAFLAISDRYATFFFWNFRHNGCRRPFWMSEIHSRSHFWPFQIDTQLFCFGNFGCPKFTFNRAKLFFEFGGRQGQLSN